MPHRFSTWRRPLPLDGGLTPTGVIRAYDLKAMEEYNGYGLTKLVSLFKGFAAKKGPPWRRR